MFVILRPTCDHGETLSGLLDTGHTCHTVILTQLSCHTHNLLYKRYRRGRVLFCPNLPSYHDMTLLYEDDIVNVFTLLRVNVVSLQLLQHTLSLPGWIDLHLLQYTKKVLQVRTPVDTSTHSQSTSIGTRTGVLQEFGVLHSNTVTSHILT